jgi:hypothetical protein
LINGKNPTQREKLFLRQQGLNPRDFLRISRTADGYVFVHRITGKEYPFRR